MTPCLTIGSLFAGIGGLELGLEWAGLGPTLWQVESDPKCRAVLATHWPGVTQYDDVRTVGAADLVPVDLIAGGFPCQDVSAAGKGAGLSGARSGLWYEFARIIDECRPRWVVIENVASGAARWVDRVVGDLGRLGYASLPIPIAAADLGAPHERARVFIVGATANADSQRQLQPRRPEPEGGRWPCDADRIWTAEPDISRMVHGAPGRLDRTRMLGNSVVPQCAEVIGQVIQRLREEASR
jgi:DNA (cytosine-5)-methyltransferase 1